MPTRQQNPEFREFRQDAFASSTEFERGVLGNLLAARCHKLTDHEEIAMLWWLQQISWREGGLEQFAKEFLVANRAQIGTPSMLKFGTRAGQIYTAAQVRAVRDELGEAQASHFPLRGEREVFWYDPLGVCDVRRLTEEEAARFPTTYSAEAFVNVCLPRNTDLAEMLQRTLVDPKSVSLQKGVPYFSALFQALQAWRSREGEAARNRIVETAIARRIYDELDFALESRSFVLIEGREGIGKSEAARAWCDQHSGQAIYVRLEAGSDETTLYRAIARRIGTACSYQRKAVEMRARIQDALQPGHVMLVLDEAHFLWPQSQRYQGSVPKRLDWLRTALVDFGVPIALISTPQYFEKQCDLFRKSGWNANQIQRRLVHIERLPENLTVADMQAVIRLHFPEISTAKVFDIAILATASMGFVGAIDHLRKRLGFLASRKGAQPEAAILDRLISEMATEACIDIEAVKAAASGKSVPAPAVAPVLQVPSNRVALPMPRRGTATSILSRTRSEQAVLSVT
jgi:hypothetical protein